MYFNGPCTTQDVIRVLRNEMSERLHWDAELRLEGSDNNSVAVIVIQSNIVAWLYALMSVCWPAAGHNMFLYMY